MSDDLIRIAANELAREVKRRRPRHVNEMATVVDVSNLASNGTVSVRRNDGTRVTAVAWTQADLQENTSVFIAPMHDDGHNKRYMVVSAKAGSQTGRWNDKWESGKRYEKGDIVRYARKTWICTDRVKGDTPPPDDPQHWDKHTESPIQNQGKWEENKTYDDGDVVRWNGRQWISLQDGNEGKEPGKSANWWERFAGQGDDQGDWNAATAYEADDIVKYGGRRYLCIQDTFPGIEPEVTENPNWELYWRLYVGSTTDKGKWESSKQYQKDDIVRYKGRTWIALAKTKGDEPSKTSNKWEIYTDKGVDNQGPWEAATYYETDMVVTYDGRSFIAIEDSLNKEPTVHPDWRNYWQIFVDKPTNDRGKYEATADYEKNDVVQYKSQTWLCIKKLDQSSNVNTQFPPGERASKIYWKKYAGGTVNKGEWDPLKLYEEDDIVTYGGSTYRATQDQNFSVEPTMAINWSTYWEVYTAGNEILDEDWSSNTKYKQGQIVRHKGNLWKCRKTHTSANGTAPGKDDTLWKLYVEKGGEVITNPDGSTDWLSTVEYFLGDIVTHKGSSWRCTSRSPIDGANNEPSNSSNKWKKIASEGKVVSEWQPAIAYAIGDKVYFKGKTYTAQSDITATQNTATEEPDNDGSPYWKQDIEGVVPNYRNVSWTNLASPATIRPGDVIRDNVNQSGQTIKVEFIAIKKQKGNKSSLIEPWSGGNLNATYWQIYASDGLRGEDGTDLTGGTPTPTPPVVTPPTPEPPENSLIWKGAFSFGGSYDANSVVIFRKLLYSGVERGDDKLYFCSAAITNSTWPDAAGSGWTPFSPGSSDSGSGDINGGLPLVIELVPHPEAANGGGKKLLPSDKAVYIGEKVKMPVGSLSTAVGAQLIYTIRADDVNGCRLAVAFDRKIKDGQVTRNLYQKDKVGRDYTGYKTLDGVIESLLEASLVQLARPGTSDSFSDSNAGAGNRGKAKLKSAYLMFFFGNPDDILQEDEGEEVG